MCSIIASYDREKLEELIELNQFRGNFSFSYSEYPNKINQVKDFGPFDISVISENNYKICHVQSPTGGMIEDYNRIHPVNINNIYLWHNGLLTPRGIKFLQTKLDTNETFDTKLLTMAISEFGFKILSEIEGLFSCLMVKNDNIYVFRTRHGKLFLDEDMNISSERFEESKCINYDTVYRIDFNIKQLIPEYQFITKRFNFVVPGEL